MRDRLEDKRQFNRYDRASSSHEKRNFQPGCVAKNLSSTRDQGEGVKTMTTINPSLRQVLLSTSRLVQPQDLPGLALRRRQTELVGDDMLREIEVALIKFTKCAGAPLRENNF